MTSRFLRQPGYFLFLSLLLFARGADFLSTWIATPNLILEGHPIARRLRWKWGIPLNVGCAPASRAGRSRIIIGTTSGWSPRAISNSPGSAFPRRGELSRLVVERLDEPRPDFFCLLVFADAATAASGRADVLERLRPGSAAGLSGTGIVSTRWPSPSIP